MSTTSWYATDTITLFLGDVRTVLRDLPTESVQCVVTSPPYWSLRDYGVEPSVWGDEEHEHEWGVASTPARRATAPSEAVRKDGYADAFRNGGSYVDHAADSYEAQGQFCPCGAWRGALGLEPTPELFVAHMVEVFREVRRVLRKDGTLWLNIGDSYAGGGGFSPDAPSTATSKSGQYGTLGSPWMLAFALRADGWWLRQDIIWAKPNPMPESVTDRCTKAHEYLFLLTKSERYYYDVDAIRETQSETSAGMRREFRGGGTYTNGRSFDATLPIENATPGNDGDLSTGRNKRSVWTIPTAPFPEAHFATFPPALVEPCVLAGTSEWGCCAECGAPWARVTETTREKDPRRHTGRAAQGCDDRMDGDWPRMLAETRTSGWRPTCAHLGAPLVPCVVLDPFVGSGTTAVVALRLKRKSVGIDLSEKYLRLAKRKVASKRFYVEPKLASEDNPFAIALEYNHGD